jgi:hypothetical protein
MTTSSCPKRAAAAAAGSWQLFRSLAPKLIHCRVARFFLVQTTQTGNVYQITRNYTKLPENIPNGRKILAMVIKYTNIFDSKAHQNIPKLGFLE